MKELHIESLSDFINFVKKATYESELETLNALCATTKDDSVQVARLRAAWVAGSEALQSFAKTSATEGDMDAPLGDPTLRELQSNWQKIYHLTLPICLDPIDALVSRLYREFRRVCPTVIPVEKARAIYSNGATRMVSTRHSGVHGSNYPNSSVLHRSRTRGHDQLHDVTLVFARRLCVASSSSNIFRTHYHVCMHEYV